MDLEPQIRGLIDYLCDLINNYLQGDLSFDIPKTSILINKCGLYSIKNYLLSKKPSEHTRMFTDVATFDDFKRALAKLKSSIDFRSGHANFYEKCVQILILRFYVGERQKTHIAEVNIDILMEHDLQTMIKSAYKAGYLDEKCDSVRQLVGRLIHTICVKLEVIIAEPGAVASRRRIYKIYNFSNDLLDYIKEQKARTLLEPESDYLDMDDEKLDFIIKEIVKWHENRLRKTQNKMSENMKFAVDIAVTAIWFGERNLMNWMEKTLDKLTEFIILRGRQESSLKGFLKACLRC